MTSHPSTIVKGGFEEGVLAHQLRLKLLANFQFNSAPHISDNNDVLECFITAETSERPEVSRLGLSRSAIRDPVNVEEAGKSVSSCVPVQFGGRIIIE